MNSPSPQLARQFALDVVTQLRDAGYQAVWAGGCVRDQLLGLEPKDYDVATSAPPQEVRKLFGPRRTIPVGVAFGVITVLGPQGAGPIEVATFRSERGYSDGRHPDHVEFSTPEIDASRRDFTINGLFYDPIAEQVLDFVGGEADLRAGIVRAIGDADARLGEDKLRMLRGVRFAARFGFQIEPATFAAIRERVAEIHQVSGERMGSEMRSMLEHASRATALALLHQTGLLAEVLPELNDSTESGWQRLLRIVGPWDQASLPMVLAGLLWASGNTTSGEEATAAAIGARWKLPNRDIDRAAWLVQHLDKVGVAHTTPWPQMQRLLVHAGAGELVDLAAAIQGEHDPGVAFCRTQLALPAAVLNPAPLVSGNDLLRRGFAAGPVIGELLEAIRDAQLEGQVRTRDEALALADKLRQE